MFDRWPRIYQFEFLLWGAATANFGFSAFELHERLSESQSGTLRSIQFVFYFGMTFYCAYVAALSARWTLWYRIQVAAFNRFNAGEFLPAANLYRYCVRLSPQGAQCHYDYGLSLANLGRYDESIQHLTQAIDLDSGEADYFKARSWVFSQLGETTLSDADSEVANTLETRH